jgi:cation transport ATPase
MKEKENEFKKALDELDQKSEIISRKKEIQIKRDEKIIRHESKKKSEKIKKENEERETAKNHNQKTIIWITVSYGSLILYFLYRRMQNDPTEFWFEVVVTIFYLGLYRMLRHSS